MNCILHRCVIICCGVLLAFVATTSTAMDSPKRVAYIVSDIKIPFWQVLYAGVKDRADDLGYQSFVLDAGNDTKSELANMLEAIRLGVDGIIMSPTNSSTAVTLLRLASNAGIPVIIADIGADEGEYVSYVTSHNFLGAYELGIKTAKLLKDKQMDNGCVGVIGIPQKRANGQARTAGFVQVMEEQGISVCTLFQMVDFSLQESKQLTFKLLNNFPNLSAIWVQTSHSYQTVIDTVKASGRDDVLLVFFDAEPEFMELIPQHQINVAAMQQPFLLGEESMTVLDKHLNGEAVSKEILLPVLPVTADNIQEEMPNIRRNVLGILD